MKEMLQWNGDHIQQRENGPEYCEEEDFFKSPPFHGVAFLLLTFAPRTRAFQCPENPQAAEERHRQQEYVLDEKCIHIQGVDKRVPTIGTGGQGNQPDHRTADHLVSEGFIVEVKHWVDDPGVALNTDTELEERTGG